MLGELAGWTRITGGAGWLDDWTLLVSPPGPLVGSDFLWVKARFEGSQDDGYVFQDDFLVLG